MIYDAHQPDLGGDISPRGNMNLRRVSIPAKLQPMRPTTPPSPIKDLHNETFSNRAKQARRAGAAGGKKRKIRMPSLEGNSNA